ncbi:MAG: ferrous iron transport protein B [Ruminococcaceae bacterium]|nr:ferrous iron transport protein B [Oscillospiraceae bacterium]
MSIRIALAGNPNCGKTTLFNTLTGSNQYVGNWPGVTVEKKEGKLKKYDAVTVTDLPGIYSLSPYTLEEVVARNYLVGERPEVILNVVDGTNLERNLYLTTQLMELGIPVVVAINMMDVVRKNGDTIDTERLSRELGCPIVEISALKGDGTWEAAEAACEAARSGKIEPMHIFSGAVEHVLAHIEEATVHGLPEERQRWYAVKLFERDQDVRDQLGLSEAILTHIEQDIVAVETRLDDDAEAIITNDRYDYITSLVARCCKKKSAGRRTLSDKIDSVVTNRILALPIFVAVMFLVYFLSIGSVGSFTVAFMNDGLFGSFAEAVEAGDLPAFMGSWVSVPELLDMALLNAEGTPVIAEWLYSLIQDGIVGGVGAVLGFVPQMLILFLLLSLLEDCGYMSRVAFIMDRIFRKFGLSGKSFIPMLVASGCGVPGIMASRTIEQDRDRKMTIMTTGFIPCGAKMPFVALVAGAFFGGSAWVATAAYFIGVGAVVLSGILLKKTKAFSGDPAPFVMELPAYHAPLPRNVLRTTWDRGWSFIVRAGTVIFMASVAIWMLNNLSFSGGFHFITEEAGGSSVLEVIGGALAYLFKPLGFGKWEATVATILGLLAKEEVVGVFGALGLGSAEEALVYVLDGSKLAGISFMIFNLLCAPCVGAMGAIKREMNNGKWTAFAIGYMCVFAYAVSLVVYQFGAWFIGAGNLVGTVSAALVLIVFLYLLLRPYKQADKLTLAK